MSRQHNRLSTRSFERVITNIGKQVDVNAHPHKLRRTLATQLNNNGMNPNDIRELLGHSNISTTQKYLAIDNSKLSREYQRFSN